jgi:recombination protein RecT
MTETSTVAGALEKRDDGPGAMIDKYRTDFATVLPTHIKPETWVRLAQGVLRRDKNLARVAQQDPGSLLVALLECARLGHEPGTEAFYLVPIGNAIEGWEGYRGVLERMFRAGGVSSVVAEVVRAGDLFVWKPGEVDRPRHEADWFRDRGEIIGAYSYAVMKDGATSKVVVLNKPYLDKVRKESRGSNSATSPWNKWEEAMVLKTAVHRLEPFVPTSSEYRAEVQRAAAQAESVTEQHPELPDPAPHVTDDDVVDAEVIDECRVCGGIGDDHNTDEHDRQNVPVPV